MSETTEDSPSTPSTVHPPLPTESDALRLLILQPRPKKGKRGPPKGNDGESSKANGAGSSKRNGGDSSKGNAGDKDEICGELVSRTFASKPVYECLSYTWGNQPADRRITINGQKFLVRKNLFDALRNLRQKTPRSLWIDAICINQEDVEERNYQVSLMAFIYRRATRAVVWLGLSPKPYTHLDRQVMYIQNEENADAIISNPYWGRLWIIQEIVLSQDVHFVHGNLEFDWHEVDQLLANSSLWNSFEEQIRPLVDHRDRRATDEYRLEALLDRFQDAQCSEKKDKIYGFLGMSHDGGDDEIEVDYSVGLFELFEKMVDFHQDSQPLQFEDPFMFEIRPELDRTVRLMKFSSLIQSLFEGGVEADVKTINLNARPKKYYYARGALACKILYIGPTYRQTVGSFKVNNIWRKNMRKYYTSNGSEATRELRQEDEVYAKEILDWDDARLARIRNIDTRTSFGFQYAAEDDDFFPDELEEAGAWNSKAAQQDPRDYRKPEPRRFLGTNSRIGFVPPNARVGDEVYNFYDCDVAVILRREGGPFSDRWKIIGKADLSCREMKEQNEQKISIEALNWVPSEEPEFGASQQLESEKESMINLKMDIEVLQKLTC